MKELLQQALDALELQEPLQACVSEHEHWRRTAMPTITALRSAFAQPAAWMSPGGICVSQSAIDEMDDAERVMYPTPLYASAAPAPVVPDGMALVPDYRGYAALGTGQYLLDISGDANPAELIIHVATEEEKAGRTVGDLRDKMNPGEMIQPDKMAVRLAFFTVAGLDALEQQLRILRETHFAASPPAPAVTEPLSDEQRMKFARDHGVVYTNRHFVDSPAVSFSFTGLRNFVEAVEAHHGIGIKRTNRDVLYFHVAADAVGRSSCDEYIRGDGLSAVGCVWADDKRSAAVRRSHDCNGGDKKAMKITLPPLPEPVYAIDEDGNKVFYEKASIVRARDLEVARVVLETAAQRLEVQATNIDHLTSRDSWDASASSVRQGACYIRALEVSHG